MIQFCKPSQFSPLNYVVRPTPAKTDAEKLIESITEAFNVSRGQLLGRRQERVISEARAAFCYLCRKRFKMLYKQIGIILNRDHSTVMYSIRQVENLNTPYSNFQIKLREAERLLAGVKKFAHTENT